MIDIDGFLTDWQLWMEENKGRSEATSRKYRGYLARLVIWCSEQTPPLDPLRLALDDLERFSGIHMHGQGLSPRARLPLIAALRGFYSWAEQKGVASHNPARDLTYPKAGRRLSIPIELHHAEAMLMQCDLKTLKGIRDAAILAILFGCGLRISGLVRLNESDLIWTRSERGSEQLVLKVDEKGAKERLVPAPAEARLLIRAYLGHADLEGIDRSLPDGDLVLFVSTRNQRIPAHEYYGEARRIAPRTINDMMERYGARAGVPKNQRHPHAARHLYGTELAEHDVDLLIRQQLMGHEDPKSTKIYTQLAMRKLITEVNRSNPLGRMRTPVSRLLRELSQGKP